MKEQLTAERLRELLTYNPHTGVFVRKKTIHYRAVEGAVAGTLMNSGYREISLDGVRYYEHRLAFLYMTGSWPPEEIDHKDLKRSNNRWLNLRPSDHHQNHGNMTAHIDNKSGFKGVSLHRATGKWTAWIMVRGKSRYLGLFREPEVAHAAYREAASRAFGEFARGT